jgi:hypothetical protein
MEMTKEANAVIFANAALTNPVQRGLSTEELSGPARYAQLVTQDTVQGR